MMKQLKKQYSISFTVKMKPIKYLRISLIKEVKDMHNENYKSLLDENEEHKQMERHPVFLDWNK